MNSLALSVEPTGRFTVSIGGGALAFSGGEVRVDGLSSTKKTLVPVGGLQKVAGNDALGPWTGLRLSWANASAKQQVLMHTTFQQYPGDPGALVFEQSFPTQLTLNTSTAPDAKDFSCFYAPDGAAADCATDKTWSSTLFPAFDRSPGPTDALPCFAYHGIFPQMRQCVFGDRLLGSYQASHQGGVPLVVYNRTDPALPMAVFSQLDWPKAQHVSSERGLVGIGVKSSVASIPAGWSQRALLSAGTGIGEGMHAWGTRMLRFAGKPRVDHRYRDAVHATIGFWTDNGGYYHYATGGKGQSYEEVLPKVKAYHDALGVRFGHWQFDSWFYPKDGGVDPGGGGGGVTNCARAIPRPPPPAAAHAAHALTRRVPCLPCAVRRTFRVCSRDGDALGLPVGHGGDPARAQRADGDAQPPVVAQVRLRA